MDSHDRRVHRGRPALLLAAAALAGLPHPAGAQTVGPAELAQATLEQLLNIHVTSTLRKDQRAEETPAAVFVITREDVRRSGLSSLAELFRLVPGMQVARINANKWAVSVRGFNDLYANTLLVLVDGRSVYNRTFSGVYWDSQDLILSDIERIEVTRGPGGAVWGANAVNGIINIVTRSAGDTKGPLVEATLGTFDGNRIATRYGGGAGTFAYRVFSQWSEYSEGRRPDGERAGDRSSSWVGGGRADWLTATDEVTTQLNLSRSDAGSNFTLLESLSPGAAVRPERSVVDAFDVLGRWTRRTAGGALWTVQSFHAQTDFSIAGFWSRERISDFDAQVQRRAGARHELVFGGGVRRASLATRNTLAVALARGATKVANGFVQDEIAVGEVALTLGTKVEHDSAVGWGLLPSARALWRASPSQHLWAGVSRARRTPAAVDRSLIAHLQSLPGDPLPVVVGVVGNPDYRSEELVQVEGGYRVRRGTRARLEITGFRGSFSHLKTIEALPPVVESTPAAHVLDARQFANLMDAVSTGVEVSGEWIPSRGWRLDGSFSAFDLATRVRPGSTDEGAAIYDGNAPASQWQVHSAWWPRSRVRLDAAFYRVGRLRALDVPAYDRLDVRGEVKIAPHLSVIGTGSNLLRARHLEFTGINSGLRESLIPRSARVELRWEF